jgi:hypothetical protein
MTDAMSKLSDSKYDMYMNMVDYLKKDSYQVTRTLDGIPIDYDGTWKLQPRTHELFNGLSTEINFTPMSGWDNKDLNRCMEDVSSKLTDALVECDNLFAEKQEAEQEKKS